MENKVYSVNITADKEVTNIQVCSTNMISALYNVHQHGLVSVGSKIMSCTLLDGLEHDKIGVISVNGGEVKEKKELLCADCGHDFEVSEAKIQTEGEFASLACCPNCDSRNFN